MVEQIDSEQVQQQYTMKVSGELLMQAHILGVASDELLEFFAVQVQAMLNCSPNFNYMGEKKRIWILRGFYPETTLFFKVMVMATAGSRLDGSSEPYYVKVSPMRMSTGRSSKFSADSHFNLSSKDLNENITNRMENSFFNAKHELKTLIRKKIKMPGCVSPRGMKIFRLEKPAKRKRKREVKSLNDVD